jgi:hypothetical protein
VSLREQFGLYHEYGAHDILPIPVVFHVWLGGGMGVRAHTYWELLPAVDM